MRRRDKKEGEEGCLGSGEWGIRPEYGPIGIKPADRAPVTEDKINLN
jgi:hypothetical protein